MSMMHCMNCDRDIDTDFDAEHTADCVDRVYNEYGELATHKDCLNFNENKPSDCAGDMCWGEGVTMRLLRCDKHQMRAYELQDRIRSDYR